MLKKDLIAEIVSTGEIIWQKHALQRMMERKISREDVKKAIIEGIIIESYIKDKPLPSVLIACISKELTLHVVTAFDFENKSVYIITAYYPDRKHFEGDFITRRKG